MSSAEEVLAALHDADDSTEEAADQEEQGALLTVVVHLVGEEGPESAPLSVEVGGGAANALRCVLLCPLQVLFFSLAGRAGSHLIRRLSRSERGSRSLFPLSDGSH